MATFTEVVLEHDCIDPQERVIFPAGTKFTVRKPGAGEFRGTNLVGMSQLDYAALETLLPRITQPRLDKVAVAGLAPSDIMAFGGEVMDFLLPTAAKQAASPQT